MSGMIQANVPVLDYGQAANRGFLTIFGAVTQAAEQARRSKIEDMMLPLEMRRAEAEIAQIDASAAKLKADMTSNRIRANRESGYLMGLAGIQEEAEAELAELEGRSGGIVRQDYSPDLPQWGEERSTGAEPLEGYTNPSPKVPALESYINPPSPANRFGGAPSMDDLRGKAYQRHLDGVDDYDTSADVEDLPLITNEELAETGGIDDMQTSTGSGESMAETSGKPRKLSELELFHRKEKKILDQLKQEEDSASKYLRSRNFPDTPELRKVYVATRREVTQRRLQKEVVEPRDSYLAKQITALPPEDQERIAAMEIQHGSLLKAFQAYKAEELKATKSAPSDTDLQLYRMDQVIDDWQRQSANPNIPEADRAKAALKFEELSEARNQLVFGQGQEAARRADAPDEADVLVSDLAKLTARLQTPFGDKPDKAEKAAMEAELLAKQKQLHYLRVENAPLLPDIEAVRTFYSNPKNIGKYVRVKDNERMIKTTKDGDITRVTYLDGTPVGDGKTEPTASSNRGAQFSPENTIAKKAATVDAKQKAAAANRALLSRRDAVKKQLDAVKQERERVAKRAASKMNVRGGPKAEAIQEQRLLEQQGRLEAELATLEKE